MSKKKVKSSLRDDFLTRFSQLCNENIEIVKQKNVDYSGIEEPFKNFRACEIYGVSAEKGILVRMCDKLARISNLLDRSNVVIDESIADSLSDLSNYAMILQVYLDFKARGILKG